MTISNFMVNFTITNCFPTLRHVYRFHSHWFVYFQMLLEMITFCIHRHFCLKKKERIKRKLPDCSMDRKFIRFTFAFTNTDKFGHFRFNWSILKKKIGSRENNLSRNVCTLRKTIRLRFIAFQWSEMHFVRQFKWCVCLHKIAFDKHDGAGEYT